MTSAACREPDSEPVETGVLLLYTGSPDSPSPKHVARYLRAFLMDPHMLTMPYLPRALLVRGIIVPVRARKSAVRYQRIWTPEGSPLAVYTDRFMESLRGQLPGYAVAAGAAYGSRAVEQAVSSLVTPALRRLVVFPLFPQYAEATHATLREQVDAALHTHGGSGLEVLEVRPFYESSHYIDAMRQMAAPRLEQFGSDHVVFSYHGLPLRQAHATRGPGLPDYEGQCVRTTALLAETLQLMPGRFTQAYQSRFGRGWLGPSTETVLEELARSGMKRVALLAPSFVTDCLETLEELDLGARDVFLAAGGRELLRVPALNDHPAWIRAAAGLVLETISQA